MPPKELTVYDAEHPRPKDELDAKGLRAKMTEAAEKQMKALEPKDEKSLAEFRRVVGTALKVMIGEDLPRSRVTSRPGRRTRTSSGGPGGTSVNLTLLGREGEGDGCRTRSSTRRTTTRGWSCGSTRTAGEPVRQRQTQPGGADARGEGLRRPCRRTCS